MRAVLDDSAATLPEVEAIISIKAEVTRLTYLSFLPLQRGATKSAEGDGFCPPAWTVRITSTTSARPVGSLTVRWILIETPAKSCGAHHWREPHMRRTFNLVQFLLVLGICDARDGMS